MAPALRTRKTTDTDTDDWQLTPDRSRWDVPAELVPYFEPWSDGDVLGEARAVPASHPDVETEARRRLHNRRLLAASYRLRSEVQAADMAAASRCVVTGEQGHPTVPGVIPVGSLPHGANVTRSKVPLSDTAALAAALVGALDLLEQPGVRDRLRALVAENPR